ncbi:uncharacterized protein [Montipora foliosa]|uniref:uncharacterized protein n=1 Tax=Montipora foliosa TaxID=591990 RepID=UPI0035F1A905
MSKQKSRRRVATTSIVSAYTDPQTPGSLGGVARYAQAQGLTQKEASRELQGEFTYTLHRPVRRRFETLPVLVFHKDEQWQADLVEVQPLKRWNGGHRNLLTVIDVLSKYAWVVPVKNKTGTAVTQAFENVLRQGRKPQRLQTDLGKEFYNAPFRRMLEREGIQHFNARGCQSIHSATLQSYVERTHTPHRSIGMAPRDVTDDNERVVWTKLYGKRLKRRPLPKLNVGDRVRLSKKHRPFKKGYLPGWTEEVFIVRRMVRGPVVTYHLEEWDGMPLEGSFYEQDVQKVTVPDDALFGVEEILQRRGHVVKVRWLGWPPKYDSWVPRSALRHV